MNILSLIQNQLSPQTIDQISTAVGESPEGTTSALGTAFPALLGSLLGKANSSPSGVTDIFNMLKQGQSQGGWSDSISNVLGSLSGGTPQAAHQSLLSSLLGSKLGPVADFIASRCGIRGSSATSLLGMAAPLLMGALGKQVASQGLGAAGLGQLLSSQGQYLKGVLPSGLANTLGIGNLLSGAPATPEIPVGAKATEQPYRESYTRPAEAAPAGSGGILKWAWVPLLLALAGWFVANRMHRTSDMGGTTDKPVVTTGHAYQAPSFANLNLTPGGIADNLAKAISKGDWNKNIELQGFTTDSTGALADSAKSSVREIGSVLSAAPTVKAKITGYGDTEEAGLSRANAIKSALMSAGIAEDRISTTGQTGTGAPTINVMR